MSRWTLADDVASHLQPLAGLLGSAASALPVGPPLTVKSGPVESPVREDGRLVLPEAWLAGPPEPLGEPAGPAALDRWRRAACAVLEGAAALAVGDLKGPAWVSVGLALDLADRACPDLGLAVPELLRAPRAPPGVEPRSGVAVFRALAERPDEAMYLARAWSDSGGPDPATWERAARWVLGAGLAAHVAFPVDLPEELDIPVDLGPWSWCRLHVPAHPRGGKVRAEGSAWSASTFAEAGRSLRCLAGSTGGEGRLVPEPGGPVGVWENVSAGGWGQIFGVRGITWAFRADGRLELALADAVAGPIAAADSHDVGTSGIVPGRWLVAGPDSVRLTRLDTTHLTQYAAGDRRGTPAVGMGQMLQAMQEQPWRWSVTGDELRLVGVVMGNPLEIRFRRSGPLAPDRPAR